MANSSFEDLLFFHQEVNGRNQMSKNSTQVDRRQFVRKSVAAAGATAVAATTVGRARACPISYDANGNIADWWCIVDADYSEPFIAIYTWENCNTGELRTTIGEPGEPIGDCSNAKGNPSCMLAIEFDSLDKITVEGNEYRFRPGIDKATKAKALRLLAKLAKGN